MAKERLTWGAAEPREIRRAEPESPSSRERPLVRSRSEVIRAERDLGAVLFPDAVPPPPLAKPTVQTAMVFAPPAMRYRQPPEEEPLQAFPDGDKAWVGVNMTMLEPFKPKTHRRPPTSPGNNWTIVNLIVAAVSVLCVVVGATGWSLRSWQRWFN